jgi:hypothetical protein
MGRGDGVRGIRVKPCPSVVAFLTAYVVNASTFGFTKRSKSS